MKARERRIEAGISRQRKTDKYLKELEAIEEVISGIFSSVDPFFYFKRFMEDTKHEEYPERCDINHYYSKLLEPMEVIQLSLHCILNEEVLEDYHYDCIRYIFEEVYLNDDILEYTDLAGNTPLHIACENGDEEAISILIEYGAKKDVLNHEGKKPIDLL